MHCGISFLEHLIWIKVTTEKQLRANAGRTVMMDTVEHVYRT